MKRLPRSVGCPTELALELLGGKWKTVILARLKERPHRYGELRSAIPRVSDKMLTQCLQALQERGLVEREEGASWRLSEQGGTLAPALQALYDWGEAQAGRLGIAVVDGSRTERARARADPSRLPESADRHPDTSS